MFQPCYKIMFAGKKEKGIKLGPKIKEFLIWVILRSPREGKKEISSYSFIDSNVHYHALSRTVRIQCEQVRLSC